MKGLPMKPSQVRRAALIGAALLFAGGLVLWHVLTPTRPSSQPEGPRLPPDPRLAYAGPFQNIHPRVQEVGDAKCAECHADIAAKFAQHPMGRSILPIAAVAGTQDYSAKAHNPFESFGATMRVERQGDRVWHKETRLGPDGKPVYEFSLPVDYVIGSGNNGCSYLSVRDGFVFQTPISWFAQKGIWDTSPGFAPDMHSGRPVLAICLYCHANRALPIEGTHNRYEPQVFAGHSIGCERCHGPGEEHVKLRAIGAAPDGKIDPTIVNPKHLEPALREGVCQQCHLEGVHRVLRYGRGLYDFRPGMPLEDFWQVMVYAHKGDDRKAVNHVEQMYLSRCFQGSNAKLGCITCHGPHEKLVPEKRVAHYRAACLKCHDDCSVPLATRLKENAANSCTDCHMPRFGSVDIVHTASTDHRIVRRPSPAGDHPERAAMAEKPLVFFPRRAPNLQDPDDVRALGLTLLRKVTQTPPPRQNAAGRALPVVEDGVVAFPVDPLLLEAKGYLQGVLGRPEESLAAYERALAASPLRESALLGAASVALAVHESEKAELYWKQVVELNPMTPLYREALAMLLARQGRWQAAAPHVDAWLTLDPASVEARQLKVDILLREGKVSAAETEFAKIEALRPRNLAELREWFSVRRSLP
jgi:tetratricopeptide (TPR) repeat protein